MNLLFSLACGNLKDSSPPASPRAPTIVEAYEKGTQTIIIDDSDTANVQKNHQVETYENNIEENAHPPPNDTAINLNNKEIDYDDHDIQQFLEKSSRLVERCLGERRVFDALRNDFEFCGEDDDDTFSQEAVAGKIITQFYSKTICQNRFVTQAKFWPQRPETVFCAYAGEQGEVALWSLARPETPEARLGSQTCIRCIKSINNTLVLGGTDTGQIVLWDLRQPHTVPVQRTPLDSHAPHAEPIINIFELPGDLCAAVSIDGVLSTWSIAQLQRPIDVTELTLNFSHSTSSQQKIFVSAADAISSSSTLLLGSDTGDLYQTTMSLQNSIKLEPHRGLVASLHAHPAAHPGTQSRIRDVHNRRRSLVATAAVDWTATVSDFDGEQNNVATLDHGPHVTVSACQWSPSRASLLATATSDGYVYLWNLGAVLDSKHARKHLHHSVKSTYKPAKVLVTNPASPNAALNCLDYAQDSKHILVGDLSGAATLLTLRDDFARPDTQDDARFDAALVRRRPLQNATDDILSDDDVSLPRRGDDDSKNGVVL